MSRGSRGWAETEVNGPASVAHGTVRSSVVPSVTHVVLHLPFIRIAHSRFARRDMKRADERRERANGMNDERRGKVMRM